jgi:Xaa-Pro aminopeptidase
MTGDGASPPERSYGAGTSAVDWESRYDFGGLRAKRIARARAAMETDHLDAVLVWKSENVRYLTSLRSQILAGKDSILNAALLIGDQPPVLLCSGGRPVTLPSCPGWVPCTQCRSWSRQNSSKASSRTSSRRSWPGAGRPAATSGWTRSAFP